MVISTQLPGSLSNQWHKPEDTGKEKDDQSD